MRLTPLVSYRFQRTALNSRYPERLDLTCYLTRAPSQDMYIACTPNLFWNCAGMRCSLRHVLTPFCTRSVMFRRALIFAPETPVEGLHVTVVCTCAKTDEARLYSAATSQCFQHPTYKLRAMTHCVRLGHASHIGGRTGRACVVPLSRTALAPRPPKNFSSTRNAAAC